MIFRKKPVYLYDEDDSTPEDVPASLTEDTEDTEVTKVKTKKEIRAELKRQKKAKKEKTAKVKKEKPPKAPRNHRISKRGIFGAASVFLAMVIALIVSPLVTRVSNEETSVIIYTKQAIPKGALLEASSFQAVTVPSRGLPKNAVAETGSIVGRYAAVDIPAEDIMLLSKVSDTIPFPDSYLYELPQGKQAMSVRIKTFESGLSGKLAAGDIVSVYSGPDSEEAKETYLAAAPAELLYLPVLSVTTETGLDYDKQAAGEKEEDLPLTVELLVGQRQARALAGLNQNSNIHLALVCRGNPKYIKYLLDTQEQLLAALEKSELEQQQAKEAAEQEDAQDEEADAEIEVSEGEQEQEVEAVE